MDASSWVHNPHVRGSKPRSAILIFIILLLLFIFVRMICLFRVSRYHLHTSIFIRVLLSLSLLAFGLALKMRATSYTSIAVSLGSGLIFPCLPRSSQKLITEVINLADTKILSSLSGFRCS